MRTNYVTNPSFEVNTANWSAYGGSGAVLSRTTSEHHTGTAALKVDTDSGFFNGCVFETSSPAGSGYTFVGAAQVKGPLGLEMSLALSVGVPGNSTGRAVSFVATGDWQYVVMSDPIQYDNPTILSIEIYFDDNYPASTFYVDEAIIETGDTVGTYFDGDTPDTLSILHSWAGTPHSSISYRTGATLPERDIPEPYGQVVSNSTKSNMTVTYRSGWLG